MPAVVCGSMDVALGLQSVADEPPDLCQHPLIQCAATDKRFRLRYPHGSRTNPNEGEPDITAALFPVKAKDRRHADQGEIPGRAVDFDEGRSAVGPQPGKRTSVKISVGSSAVARYETKNCCGESTRGVVVPRPWRATMKMASSAAATAGSSAAGSAWARLPPMVPRFRICGCPTHRRASARSGTWAVTTGDRSAVRWRVSAPMRIVPFSSLM